MLVQHDPDRPNGFIAIRGSHLLVSPFQAGQLHCPGGEFDLESYRGDTFRLYLDDDGSLSSDKNRDHFWLLVEAVLPSPRYVNVDTGRTDANGSTLFESLLAPLDLDDPEIQVVAFPLPEVA